MAPFYGSPGINLNGTQVSSITMVGNGVNVDTNIVNIPGVVLNGSSITVTSPIEINLAGTATLTEGVLTPSIVQANNGYGSTSLVSPTIGNHVIVFTQVYGNGFSDPAGFSIISKNNEGSYNGMGVYIAEVSASFPITNISCPNNGIIAIEVANYFSNSYSYGAAGVSGIGPYNFTSSSILTTLNDLVLCCFFVQEQNAFSFSSPLPAGSTIAESASALCLLSFKGDGSSYTFGVTGTVTSSGPTNGNGFGVLTLPFNPASSTATITT